MKLVVVSEVPTPYRTPLFDRLRREAELYVLYCAARDPWRGSARPDLGPAQEVLSGLSFGGMRGGVNWKLNPSVWRRLSALRPDVVVVSGYAHPTMQLAMLWCRAHKVPYILHSESNDLTPRALWRRVLKAPAVRWAISGAASFLPVSTSASDYLSRRGGDRSRMFMLPNAPDVERIAHEASSIPRDTAHPPTFVFVGRLVPAKDPQTLLEAFASVRAELPSARLRIVGEGPLQLALEAFRARRALDGVEFLGFVDQRALISLYAAADCFVLPSTYEPYGVVVLEAMAAGLPVVLSDRVGSASDLVRTGENGFIFEAGNNVELARRMLEVISADAAKMGVRSRLIASGFSYASAVATVLDAVRLARASVYRLSPPR